MTATETYAIIDSEGYYGDWCTVWETYTDAAKAHGAKLRGGSSVRLVSGCHEQAGDKVSRGIVQDMIAAGLWKVVR